MDALTEAGLDGAGPAESPNKIQTRPVVHAHAEEWELGAWENQHKTLIYFSRTFREMNLHNLSSKCNFKIRIPKTIRIKVHEISNFEKVDPLIAIIY